VSRLAPRDAPSWLDGPIICSTSYRLTADGDSRPSSCRPVEYARPPLPLVECTSGSGGRAYSTGRQLLGLESPSAVRR